MPPTQTVTPSPLVQIFTNPAVIVGLTIIIVVLITLLIFRKQFGGFIEKHMTKVKVGKGGFEMEGRNHTEEPRQDETIEQVASEPEPAKEEDKPLEETSEPVTRQDWMYKMFFAIHTKKEEDAKTAYEKALALSVDDKEKKKTEIAYNALRQMFLGKEDALRNIEKFLNDPDSDIKSFALERLGMCYHDSGDYSKAVEYYKTALGIPRAEEDKVDIVLKLSRSYYEDDQKPKAIEFLQESINDFESIEIKGSIYEALAELYLKEEDTENRAFCLEKALQFKPNNPKLLFSAGYAYGQEKMHDLALLHYKQGKSVGTEDSALINNLGVAYGNLELPILSVKEYKEAFKNGETLAGSNLAYRYINEGFEQEAKDVLDKSRASETVHPNVGEALATLSKNKEAEAKRETNLIKMAEKKRKFILDFADAYYPVLHENICLPQNWQNEKGVEYEVTVADDDIIIIWEESGEKYKILGHLKNRGAKFLFYKYQYRFTTSKMEYVKQSEGLLYISADLKTIKMVTDPTAQSFVFNTITPKEII